jgi:hypothetical protein
MRAVIVGKYEEERAFGRPENRWEDNMKTDIKYSVKLYGPIANGEPGNEPSVSHKRQEMSCPTE